jgi:hypothetical protein
MGQGGNVGQAGLARARVKIQPMVGFIYRNTFPFADLFQFGNHFEFKSNLNFERFLLTKLNLIAHFNTKELCNGISATTINIYLNIFLSFIYLKNRVLQ